MYKRIIALALIGIIIGSNISYGESNMSSIETSGKSAVVMDVETGRVLYDKNIHTKMPMASTTKIMTALLAIENIPLEKMVKIHRGAEGVEGSSIYLRANEDVKAIDLIYGLMLRSGNDAAVAIAYEVSGSVEEFADLMNQRAKELGAQNTNFMNPHGLHDDNHYTTSYDLALITREALKNEVFKKVSSTKFWTADRNGYRNFANKNKSLDMCEGGDGVKTGYTIRAGRCLVTSATRNGMQLIAVTLNDYNWFETTKNLLDAGFNEYKPYTLFDQNQIIRNINILEGKKKDIRVKVNRNVVIPLKEDEVNKIITVMDIKKDIEAPIEDGVQIGKAVTYLDGKIISTNPIFSDESVERQNLIDKIKNIFAFVK